MYETILQTLLRTSIIAAIAAIIVMLLRIPLKKAPRRWSYLLWAVVFFRCICPASFESEISIFNAIPDEQNFSQTETIENADEFYIDNTEIYKDYTVNADMTSYIPAENTEIPKEKNISRILVIIWLSGTAVMLLYGIISYIILKSRLKTAVKISDNIYETDRFSSAFSAGAFPAKIYIPAGYSEEQRRFMIVHEKTHIKRFDHISKIIAFIGLSVHWFDPFIWASFILMTRDMELSCDEAVLRQLGAEEKTAYSHALLQASMKSSGIISLPTAFAEKGIKERVKNALAYKKPKVFVTIIAVIAVLAAFAVLGTNAVKNEIKTIDEIKNDLPVVSNVATADIDGEKFYIIKDPSPLLSLGMTELTADEDQAVYQAYKTGEPEIHLTEKPAKAVISNIYKTESGYWGITIEFFNDNAESEMKFPIEISTAAKEKMQTYSQGGNAKHYDINYEIEPRKAENSNACGIIFMGFDDTEIFISDKISAENSDKLAVSVSYENIDTEADDIAENEISDPYAAVLDPNLKYLNSDLQADTFYLLNEFSGTDIKLYGSYNSNSMQVIIEHDGIRDLFDQVWDPLPFRADILAAYGDYDGDGKKEISAAYNTGHGTGVSVWQLVIYKMNDDGHFEDLRTDVDAIGEAFRNAVDISVDNGTKNISYTVGGKTRTSSYADNFADEYYGGNVTSENIRFTDQLHFTLDGDKIFCSVSPGLITTYYGDELTGEVKFDGKIFSIENIGFADFGE